MTGVTEAGNKHRALMAQKSRENSAAAADIGAIPKPANPRRRKRCAGDLFKFLTTYFPHSTGLNPFSDDHREMITDMQSVIMDGGREINAVYRGFAKTTISENAALWGLLNGYRRYIAIFAATEDDAREIIDSIKSELETNELLAEDFPEVCLPIIALEGKTQRCASQTHNGELTRIEWRGDKIVLPSIKGSAASAAVIKTWGLKGAIRGMKHKRPDGTQQRPDLAIIDDPQTDEIAENPLQVAKLMKRIQKSILKSTGHTKTLSVVMNATVICKGDLVDQLLSEAHAVWHGRRVKMVRQWADAHDTLWLGEYARIRETYDPESKADQRRAHADATAFYRAHRKEMDAGCVVSWKHCFDPALEISAIQHAYNALIDDGEEVFASEYQCDPIDPNDSEADDFLPAIKIAKLIANIPRGVVPAEAQYLVSFVDVQKRLLYYVVAAWAADFTGWIVDYGTLPEQRTATFTAANAKTTLAGMFRRGSFEGDLYAGLEALGPLLLARQWMREDGSTMRIRRMLIDANWGESKPVVNTWALRSPHAAVLLPSHGKYVKPGETRIADYRRSAGTLIGDDWMVPPGKGGGPRRVIFDTNRWKTFLQRRYATPAGVRGRLTLYGDDRTRHDIYAQHQTSETRTILEANGLRCDAWRLRPGQSENHWLDCATGCCVAGSIEGARLGGKPPKRQRRKRRRGAVSYA